MHTAAPSLSPSTLITRGWKYERPVEMVRSESSCRQMLQLTYVHETPFHRHALAQNYVENSERFVPCTESAHFLKHLENFIPRAHLQMRSCL
jgi:hypothetical protein